jgi:hypothetical protein
MRGGFHVLEFRAFWVAQLCGTCKQMKYVRMHTLKSAIKDLNGIENS